LSSFSGSLTQPNPNSALQLAPEGEDGPDFSALKDAFQRAITESQPYIDQCRQNYQTRYALWTGQTADGKKHSREGSKIDPTPWDGASDLRVYLTDNLINKKVAMMRMAFKRGALSATPIEGNDIKRSRVVSNFMRWLIQTQMPDVDREIELLANYIQEKGIGVTGQFWETTQEKTLTTLRLDDFQAQFPQFDVPMMLATPDLADKIAAVFEEQFGCSKGKAKRMIRELRETGETTVATLGKEKSRPVLRAFNLDSDLFVSSSTTDIENAAGIYRVQYFTPEKLRSFANSEGWNKDWVEKAIETCRGQLLTLQPVEFQQWQSRSFIFTQQRNTDMIGVVFAYQRLSDEDGVPGIYLTVFNPNLAPDKDQPGYAKFSLLGYAHGQYPFVIHRREYLSRRLHDSRGLPEPLKPLQDQIKAHKDSRIDAASISVIPTILYKVGKPPSRIGPGARIPVSRPDEVRFMDRIMPDMNNDSSEDRLASNAKDYVGFASVEGDPQVSPLENQSEIDKFLTGLCKAFQQVWGLYKQFGSEQVFFRVIGLREADPMLFEKGTEEESFDFYMSWNVENLDSQKVKDKIASVVQLAQYDRDGSVNWSELVSWAMESSDPNVAERIMQPASIGSQKVVKEVQDDLSKLSAGINVNMRVGTPPQLAMQALKNWIGGAPDVQKRLQRDKPFADRVKAYAKQVQFQQMQQQNKEIGRRGASMPGPVMKA